MYKIQFIEQPQPKERKEREKEKMFVINQETNTVEWTTGGITNREIDAISRLLRVKNPPVARWIDIARQIGKGKSLLHIAKENRGKVGYSIAAIKALSSALSKIRGKG